MAAQVLTDLDVTAEAVRKQVLTLLGGGQSPAANNLQGKKQAGKTTATPSLNEYGRDLTLLAQEGKVDPVIGRAKEIERVIQVLTENKIIRLNRRTGSG